MGVTRRVNHPLQIRKHNNRWVVYRWNRIDHTYEWVEAFWTFPAAVNYASDKVAQWKKVHDDFTGLPLTPLTGVAQHLQDWDKRHRPNGNLRLRYRIDLKIWLPALGCLMVAAIAAVLVIFLWPHEPDSVLPSNVYTPFTKVPQPTRPPHPLSVYVPPGYEGR